jgi:hypothetical protein
MRCSKKINLPEFKCDVTVILTDDPKTEVLKLRKKHTDVEALTFRVEGIMIAPDSDKSKYYLILDIKVLSHNLISHEVYHLVRAVSEDRCMENDEESLAWISGFVAENIYNFLNKKKVDIK